MPTAPVQHALSWSVKLAATGRRAGPPLLAACYAHRLRRGCSGALQRSDSTPSRPPVLPRGTCCRGTAAAAPVMAAIRCARCSSPCRTAPSSGAAAEQIATAAAAAAAWPSKAASRGCAWRRRSVRAATPADPRPTRALRFISERGRFHAGIGDRFGSQQQDALRGTKKAVQGWAGGGAAVLWGALRARACRLDTLNCPAHVSPCRRHIPTGERAMQFWHRPFQSNQVQLGLLFIKNAEPGTGILPAFQPSPVKLLARSRFVQSQTS